MRDQGRLKAAADRPRNLYLYDHADLFRLAASYAHGMAAGHPFVDGNKRVSLVACMTFLDMNGIAIQADAEEIFAVWIGLATSAISETDLATWLSDHQAVPPAEEARSAP